MSQNQKNSRSFTADLIRHGQPSGGIRYRGHVDDPLCDEGWKQMWAAVNGYSGWDVIVTSPLKRCLAFADCLGQQIGVPVVTEDCFMEMSFGDWEGKSWEEIAEEYPEQSARFWDDPANNPPPGGESLQSFRHRVLVGFASMRNRYVGHHVLCITHGGVIRVVLQDILSLPDDSLLRMHVPFGSLSRVRYENDTSAEAGLIFHGGVA